MGVLSIPQSISTSSQYSYSLWGAFALGLTAVTCWQCYLRYLSSSISRRLILMPSTSCISRQQGTSSNSSANFRLLYRASRMIPVLASLSSPSNSQRIRVKHRSINLPFAVRMGGDSPEMIEHAPMASMQVLLPEQSGTCFSHSTRKSLLYSSPRITSNPSHPPSGFGGGTFGLAAIPCASRYSKKRRSSRADRAGMCGKRRRRCSRTASGFSRVGSAMRRMAGSTFLRCSPSSLLSQRRCCRQDSSVSSMQLRRMPSSLSSFTNCSSPIRSYNFAIKDSNFPLPTPLPNPLPIRRVKGVTRDRRECGLISLAALLRCCMIISEVINMSNLMDEMLLQNLIFALQKLDLPLQFVVALPHLSRLGHQSCLGVDVAVVVTGVTAALLGECGLECGIGFGDGSDRSWLWTERRAGPTLVPVPALIALRLGDGTVAPENLQLRMELLVFLSYQLVKTAYLLKF